MTTSTLGEQPSSGIDDNWNVFDDVEKMWIAPVKNSFASPSIHQMANWPARVPHAACCFSIACVGRICRSDATCLRVPLLGTTELSNPAKASLEICKCQGKLELDIQNNKGAEFAALPGTTGRMCFTYFARKNSKKKGATYFVNVLQPILAYMFWMINLPYPINHRVPASCIMIK